MNIIRVSNINDYCQFANWLLENDEILFPSIEEFVTFFYLERWDGVLFNEDDGSPTFEGDIPEDVLAEGITERLCDLGLHLPLNIVYHTESDFDRTGKFIIKQFVELVEEEILSPEKFITKAKENKCIFDTENAWRTERMLRFEEQLKTNASKGI